MIKSSPSQAFFTSLGDQNAEKKVLDHDTWITISLWKWEQRCHEDGSEQHTKLIAISPSLAIAVSATRCHYETLSDVFRKISTENILAEESHQIFAHFIMYEGIKVFSSLSTALDACFTVNCCVIEKELLLFSLFIEVNVVEQKCPRHRLTTTETTKITMTNFDRRVQMLFNNSQKNPDIYKSSVCFVWWLFWRREVTV